MLTIAIERYHQIIDDILPLLEEHWREVAHYQDKIPLSPMFEKYRQLDKMGNIIIIAMRMDGQLIGYSIYIITQHIHYSTCLCAANDLLYLIPEYRGMKYGLQLVKESERLLTDRSINRITYHIKPEHDFSPLLKSLGYMQEEIMYGKFISSEGE